jgi:Rps23 Pro-64 3,4-dihydroxylase Tpa1-like proline 4-hydroxylase
MSPHSVTKDSPLKNQKQQNLKEQNRRNELEIKQEENTKSEMIIEKKEDIIIQEKQISIIGTHVTRSVAKIDQYKVSEGCAAASKKKRDSQESQATYMKKLRVKTTPTAKLGSLVAIQVDSRDLPHANALLVVAFNISNTIKGGCQVVTSHRIISKTWTKNNALNIPKARYKGIG